MCERYTKELTPTIFIKTHNTEWLILCRLLCDTDRGGQEELYSKDLGPKPEQGPRTEEVPELWSNWYGRLSLFLHTIPYRI